MTITHRGPGPTLADLDAGAFADELALVASSHFPDFHAGLYPTAWDDYKRALATVEALFPAVPFDHPVILLDEEAVALAGAAFAAGLEVGAASAQLYRALTRRGRS